MLWFLFPGALVKSRIEAALHAIRPELQWDIGAAHVSPLPLALQLTESTIRETASGKELLRLKSLHLSPDLWAFLQRRELSVAYRIVLPVGTIEGRLNVPKTWKVLRFNGTMTGIRLDTLKGVLEKLDRSLSGTLSGDFRGRAQLHKPGVIELEGTSRIVQGNMSFQEPVLGMDQLAFTEVRSRVRYESGVIHFFSGRMSSRLLGAELTGTVQLDSSMLSQSALRLQGVLIPRPEFLSSLGDEVIVNQFKKQLQDGRLPFTVKGSLEEPGIIFLGVSPDFNKRLQVRGR
jgi:type II secretion system protein N